MALAAIQFRLQHSGIKYSRVCNRVVKDSIVDQSRVKYVELCMVQKCIIALYIQNFIHKKISAQQKYPTYKQEKEYPVKHYLI